MTLVTSPTIDFGSPSEPVVAMMSTAQLMPRHQLVCSLAERTAPPTSVSPVSIASSVIRRRRKCAISRLATAGVGVPPPVPRSLKWSNQRVGTPQDYGGDSVARKQDCTPALAARAVALLERRERGHNLVGFVVEQARDDQDGRRLARPELGGAQEQRAHEVGRDDGRPW